MNIKRFAQLSENFTPTNEFVTKVKASMSPVPDAVEIDNCQATVYWNSRINMYKDHFSFDVWLSKVVVECVWKTVDLEGEVITEEDKTFTYTSEQVTGSQPSIEELQYAVMPTDVEVYFNKSGQTDVEVHW